jgi:outer membrane protein
MNKLVLLISKGLLACACATVLVHAQGASKFAIIDMKKAFDSYYKTKQAEGQIKDRAADSDKVYKGMIEDYKKANEEYKKLVDQSNDQALASEEREKRKKSAETKLMELQEIEKSVKQFETQARTSIGEMEKRMRDKIVGEIRDVVNNLARAGGYNLVFDVAAVTAYQTPIILFNNGENDLTEAVIKEINAGAPAGSLSSTAGETKPGSTPAGKTK